MFSLLEKDLEVQTYLLMANEMAVKRLGYNDHGPLHSRISTGSALEIFELLADEALTLEKTHSWSRKDSELVVLCGAYLHDIGNAIHRDRHTMHGCVLAAPILDRLLSVIYIDDKETTIKVKDEILHSIYAHDDDIICLSIEAGVSKVADGTDMAEGRARIPYEAGKVDIHSLSALSIRNVDIVRGDTRPVRILVDMDNPAGIFQIEHVLQRKINTSGIKSLVEVMATERGQHLKTITL
ncbi:MAG: HD domain-containing protein [Nitrososphaeria archaeon]|nr:HD domain-containing protein [Nitrososphaeria archaeon]